MAGFMKRTMSYLGMSDVVPEDEDDEVIDEAPESSFDTDRSVTPIPAASTQPSTSQRKSVAPFHANINRITTIHPQSYEDAQLVGRALRDGIPVVLNLTDVSQSQAYRIIDFSSGVVFGISGSIERVTERVFLLSPARVDIVAEDTESGMSDNLFEN